MSFLFFEQSGDNGSSKTAPNQSDQPQQPAWDWRKDMRLRDPRPASWLVGEKQKTVEYDWDSSQIVHCVYERPLWASAAIETIRRRINPGESPHKAYCNQSIGGFWDEVLKHYQMQPVDKQHPTLMKFAKIWTVFTKFIANTAIGIVVNGHVDYKIDGKSYPEWLAPYEIKYSDYRKRDLAMQWIVTNYLAPIVMIKAESNESGHISLVTAVTNRLTTSGGASTPGWRFANLDCGGTRSDAKYVKRSFLLKGEWVWRVDRWCSTSMHVYSPIEWEGKAKKDFEAYLLEEERKQQQSKQNQ